MPITQTPKYFLALLFCLPVSVSAASKSVSSDPANTVKVHPANQTGKTSSAQEYPKRGMTMMQVRKQYGEPGSIRRSNGKRKKQWPRITVWNYGQFSVYFERHITLHTVVH